VLVRTLMSPEGETVSIGYTGTPLL